MEHGFDLCWIDESNTGKLGNIAEEVFDHAIDPARLKTYLASPNNWMCVAMHGDLVVGMCMAVIHHHPDKPTEIFLDEIGTGRDWRRKGIADSLIRALCERADAEGIEEIWVATEVDNAPARALYEKSGATAQEAAVYYYLEW